MDQQFCLRWNNHQSTLINVLDNLLSDEKLVDVTLTAEGQVIGAHKLILSACSIYFEEIFSLCGDKHPVIFLKDVKFNDLKCLLDYMYRGEVNVSQDQLPCLIKTAESLKIKGLADGVGEERKSVNLPCSKNFTDNVSVDNTFKSREASASPVPKRAKRVRSKSGESTDVEKAVSPGAEPAPEKPKSVDTVSDSDVNIPNIPATITPMGTSEESCDQSDKFTETEHKKTPVKSPDETNVVSYNDDSVKEELMSDDDTPVVEADPDEDLEYPAGKIASDIDSNFPGWTIVTDNPYSTSTLVTNSEGNNADSNEGIVSSKIAMLPFPSKPVSQLGNKEVRDLLPRYLRFLLPNRTRHMGYGKPECRPEFWPIHVPWHNIFKSPGGMQPGRWTGYLRDVVSACIRHAGFDPESYYMYGLQLRKALDTT